MYQVSIYNYYNRYIRSIYYQPINTLSKLEHLAHKEHFHETTVYVEEVPFQTTFYHFLGMINVGYRPEATSALSAQKQDKTPDKQSASNKGKNTTTYLKNRLENL